MIAVFLWIPWGVLVGAVGAALLTMGYARLTAAPSSWEAARRLQASIRSLGRALVPLALPVLVVAAVATTQYRWPSQLIAGALLAGLLWFLFRGEGEIARERHRVWNFFYEVWQQIHAAFDARFGGRPQLRTTRREVPPGTVPAFVGVLVVGLALPIFNFAQEGWTEWKTATGWSGALVWTGLQLLLIAGVFRLVGYATSVTRWLIVVAVALICTRLSALIGVLPGESRLDRRLFSPAWSLALLGLLLLSLLASEAIRLAGCKAARPSVTQLIFRGAGFLATFASALAFAVGTIWAQSETTAGATPIRGAVADPEPVQLVDVSGDSRRRLAWTFAPILRLHPDEQFPPTSARDYLARAGSDCNSQDGGTCAKVSCPTCSDPATATEPALHPEGFVLYARVATKEADPEALEGWTPGDDPLDTLIQYWIFYDYNRWQAKTVFGSLVQEHDADWEFVAVGLDKEQQPLFLALSAHCGGQVVRWEPGLAVLPGRVFNDRVEIEIPTATGDLPTADRKVATHPIVAVALGSHGNYADDSGRRPPAWGSCKKLPSESLGPLTYASNVRDLTVGSSDNRRLVQASDIEIVTSTAYPLSVRGPWGAETLSFGRRTFAPTKGPRAPPAQMTWNRPVRLFFCDRFWRAFEKGSGDDCG